MLEEGSCTPKTRANSFSSSPLLVDPREGEQADTGEVNGAISSALEGLESDA